MLVEKFCQFLLGIFSIWLMHCVKILSIKITFFALYGLYKYSTYQGKDEIYLLIWKVFTTFSPFELNNGTVLFAVVQTKHHTISSAFTAPLGLKVV